MNYDDLDVDESAKLLKEFFKNNPAFTDPELNKAKILYDEQKDNLIDYYDAFRYENPLLIYTRGTSVNISEKFRGVLINDEWVIYCGKSTKYYWSITNLNYPYPLTNLFKPFRPLSEKITGGYCQFSSPNMVDITAYVFKSSQKFINWNNLPWGDLK